VKLISVGIFEDDGGAPRFSLWRCKELNSFGLQFLIGLLDVVRVERKIGKASNPALMTRRSKKGDSCLGSRDLQLNPALTPRRSHRLVSDDREAELFRVELERLVLVAYRNADEFDSFDYVFLLSIMRLVSGRK
jgi:hypothetical protein